MRYLSNTVDDTRAAMEKAGDVDLLVYARLLLLVTLGISAHEVTSRNNAGVFIGESFLTATIASWDRVMNVNLRAAFVVCPVSRLLGVY